MSATVGRGEPLLQMTLLGEAVEHAPVGIFVFDDEGRYVAANAHEGRKRRRAAVPRPRDEDRGHDLLHRDRLVRGRGYEQGD
jgi:PAS domain-containing protein